MIVVRFLMIFILGAGILFACTSEKKQNDGPKQLAQNRIDSIEALIHAGLKAGQMPEIKTAMYMIEAYEIYYQDFPEDSALSGMYMRKAGEIYENMLKDPHKAIKRYLTAYDQYPDFDKRPMALFRAASLYQDMNDTTNAIRHFEMFIQNHPDHDFADDAQNMIKITRIGMDAFIQQAVENAKKDSIVQ